MATAAAAATAAATATTNATTSTTNATGTGAVQRRQSQFCGEGGTHARALPAHAKRGRRVAAPHRAGPAHGASTGHGGGSCGRGRTGGQPDAKE